MKNEQIDFHTKPLKAHRSVEDALKNAQRLREELPNVIQVRASDWDIVILADEVKRLSSILSE